MGLFNSLMSKIFGHAAPAADKGPQTAAAAPTVGATQTAGSAAQPAPAPAPPVVDIAAVLNDMAGKNPEKLDWRKIDRGLDETCWHGQRLWGAKAAGNGTALYRRYERFRFNEHMAAQASACKARRERRESSPELWS